jgi:3alpha(or 20beta)-hydroxysteroid dehydrogenase
LVAAIIRAGRVVGQAGGDEFLKLVAVSQLGVSLGMKTAVRLMRRTGGAIINVSSTAGFAGSSSICANTGSKFAVRGITKVAAVEFVRYNIRVNSVHPGIIDTDMVRGMYDEPAFRPLPTGTCS